MSDLPQGAIVAVRIGSVQQHARRVWEKARTPTWRSAFWKEEAPGAVQVGRHGLAGDEQADRRAHGGPEMAVLMYADAHYAYWRSLAGLEAMGPGGFAENLTVRGLDETSVCIGDVLEAGGAELEVASPRGPCKNISRRWDAEWLLEQVRNERRTGWYLRVKREGPVRRGDPVRVIARPCPDWTVDRLLRLRYVMPRSRAELEQASALTPLTVEWRVRFAGLPAGD
jgi:MOSC domain-containing protein YiiM